MVLVVNWGRKSYVGLRLTAAAQVLGANHSRRRNLPFLIGKATDRWTPSSDHSTAMRHSVPVERLVHANATGSSRPCYAGSRLRARVRPQIMCG